MKKILAMLLALTMALTMTACGSKQEETTTAPAVETTAAPTEAATTPAPTEAPTTPAPTTPAPTTPAPTTTAEPASTETPADESPQGVFNQIMQNMLTAAQGMSEEDAEAMKLRVEGQGNLDMSILIAMGDQKMDLPMKASGTLQGVLDNKKGAHVEVSYLADLGMLAMLLGGGGDSGEASQGGKIEIYADMESGKIYERMGVDEEWVYSDLKMESLPVEADKIQLNPDDFFAKYDFYASSDGYLYEGDLKLDELIGLGEAVGQGQLQEIAEMLSLDQLKAGARIKADTEKRLTEFTLTISDFALDLSSLMDGFQAKLEELGLTLHISYDEGEYELPASVKAAAVPKPVGNTDDYPWLASEFTLKDEVIASPEQFDLSVASVEAQEDGAVDIAFLVDNHTDKALSFEVRDVQVCGYSVSAFSMEDIEASKQGSFKLSIWSDDLKPIGLSSIDEIRFHVGGYEKDGDDTTLRIDEDYVIYPTGVKEGQVKYPERKTAENEAVILDNEDVTVVLISCGKDEFFGYEVLAYFENKSEQDLRFEFGGVKVNDKEIEDPYWSASLKAGARGYRVLGLSDSTVKKAGADPLEVISATLEVKEDDFFAEKALHTETFSFKVD